ncbi:uncharacterized protein peak3 [Oryzias melastigma]|uniref:uncharacterized protein peak3 n=1 Tax=Oryzias melastigma TaxID=30732 RepID=UPI00168CE74B|nr:uncharacterized protein peak3 [Oryzias melastigma]
MASAAERGPPALPVKQHRCSSSGSDAVLLSTANDAVFSDTSDCHAPQCPIHQRKDVSKHEIRFFSEGTPPPVPRKRLTRTLSLPGSGSSSSPPWSPLPRRHLNIDNPLYMMAPIPDSCFHEEGEGLAAGSAFSSPSFSQLSLDTPDEHLCALFQNFVDQDLVSEGLQHRHLLFLRSATQTVEAQRLQRGVASRRLRSQGAWDFLQCQASEPKRVGDQTFYRLHNSRFPEMVLCLRVCSPQPAASSAQPPRTPPHANVRDVLVCLQPAAMLMPRSSAHLLPAAADGRDPGPPAGRASPGTVQTFLQGGVGVSVERDLPLATMEDFVQDSPQSRPADYCRQVCVLLLQVLLGSLHLHSTCAAAAELQPRHIFLVWPTRGGGERDPAVLDGAEQSRGVQVLWRALGTPRVVLTPRSPADPEPLVHIQQQLGALVSFCLPPLESPAAGGVSPRPLHHRGLLYLSSLLQGGGQLQMTNAAVVLQVLLWGPQVPHLSTVTARRWLASKRALLLLTMAEAGLAPAPLFLDWEDCMRLRFLSFADPETVASVAARLWDSLNKDGQV